MDTGANWHRNVGETMIPFGEWLPDQPDHMNAGVVTATNVIPSASGYKPFPQLISYSNAATATIRGIYAAKDNDGNVALFAGDSGKLYKFTPSSNNLTDVSKAGSPAYDLTGNERWRFVQFGQYVLVAGGIGEEIQKWDLSTDTAFSNLGGSPPNAEFIAVVRDFIWTANIEDSGGRVPFRTRWSAFNSIDSWTVGTDQADFQDLPDSGAITGLVGGEYATILCERAIFRATYTGPPLIWQFDRVESQIGCKLAGSVCNYGSLTFFLSDNGFHAFDGQKATPIGNEKVDKFFEKDFNDNYKDNVSAAVDPLNQIAVWSYPSIASTSGDCDRLLIFNYALNRWSLVEVTTNFIAPFFSGGYTMDNLNNLSATLDGLTTVLDSQLFRGGEYFFGGAINNKLATFTGDPLAATIETGEVGIAKGKHGIVTRVYPYFEDGSVTMEVGTRNTPTSTVTFTSPVAMNVDGFCPFRAQGRYHRTRMNLTGNWSNAQGLDVDAREIGRR